MRCLIKGGLLSIVLFDVEQFCSLDMASRIICLRGVVRIFEWYAVVSSYSCGALLIVVALVFSHRDSFAQIFPFA